MILHIPIHRQKHHFLQIRFDTQAVCVYSRAFSRVTFICWALHETKGRAWTVSWDKKKPEKKCSHCLSRNNYWAFLEIFFSNKVVAKVVRGMTWGTYYSKIVLSDYLLHYFYIFTALYDFLLLSHFQRWWWWKYQKIACHTQYSETEKKTVQNKKFLKFFLLYMPLWDHTDIARSFVPFSKLICMFLFWYTIQFIMGDILYSTWFTEL